MTRKSFIYSLFLAPFAGVVGKAANMDTYNLCVPCGRPYRDGDELWGKNLGYKAGDTFIYNRKRWIIVDPSVYLAGKRRQG